MDFNDAESLVEEAFGNIKIELKGNQLTDCKEAIAKAMSEHTPLKNLLGFDEAMMEWIYGQAYRLYQTGQYVKAVPIFQLLRVLSPENYKYVFGEAACYQKLECYTDAINIYMDLSVFDKDNPIPLFHMADCFHKLDDPVNATVFYRMCLDRCKGKAQYRLVVERSKLALERLSHQIDILAHQTEERWRKHIKETQGTTS